MALPATDSFTNSDGVQLTTHSASWTLNPNGSGDFDIQSNAVAPDVNNAADFAAHWNADAFDDNQYAEGVIAAISAGDFIGVAARCATDGGANWYGFTSDSADASYLFKYVSGSFTQLGSTGNTFSATDTVRIEASGTTLTPLIDGSTTGTPGAQTDSAHASGAGGISGFDDGSGSRLDDFEADNLVTSQAAAGSLTPAGSLARKMLKSLAGALTPSGSLATVLLRVQAAAGSLTPVGALALKPLKALAGVLTPAGSLARKTLKSLAGTLTPSGALSTVKVQFQAVAGAITPAGSLVRKSLKALVGALTPTGALARKTLKPLAGSLAPSGSLSTVEVGEIFHITHEVGDLSEYTSTVTDGGDLSVTGAAALVGSFGLSCLIDDTTSIYGQVDFTQLTSTSYRFRIYLDPNSLTMSGGDIFDVASVLESTNLRALLRFNFSGGNYRIRLLAFDDAASANSTSFYTMTDDVHYVEALIEYASSDVANDGQATLWIDGVQQEQLTGLDIFDIAKPDNARFGAVSGLDAGTSGTLFLDDFVLRDDDTEIGAAPGPSGASPWYIYAQQ